MLTQAALVPPSWPMYKSFESPRPCRRRRLRCPRRRNCRHARRCAHQRSRALVDAAGIRVAVGVYGHVGGAAFARVAAIAVGAIAFIFHAARAAVDAPNVHATGACENAAAKADATAMHAVAI